MSSPVFHSLVCLIVLGHIQNEIFIVTANITTENDELTNQESTVPITSPRSEPWITYTTSSPVTNTEGSFSSDATTESKTSPETEPEVTSSPETEPEVTSSPETESEVTSPETESEVTSPETEPQVTSSPETEPEFTASTETEPEVTSSPETKSEVTSPESEPEVRSSPETEPEVTSSPEIEPEVTSSLESEPEVTSSPETEPEVTSSPETEPEITSSPEIEPEVTASHETEPEVTSSPETEPEITSSPEIEPEVTASHETEPEVTSSPETEPEVTLSPESEPEVTSPETKPEVTSIPETEPEVTFSPETEPEVTLSPESEPEVTSPETEPEVTSIPETEPEVTSPPETEPEVTSSPETEPEVTSSPETEPEGTLSPESEPEVTSPESEPEVTSSPESEPEVTSSPETEPEVTSSPESEILFAEPAESEPESEINSNLEITSEPESMAAEPEIRPSPLEIILPPFALIFVIGIAGLVLLLNSHCKRIMLLFNFKRRPTCKEEKTSSTVKLFDIDNEPSPEYTEFDNFYSAFDKEVIESLSTAHNRPLDLFIIALPAITSLALCPLTLYLYVPLVNFLWPPEEFAAAPDINDAVACFLAPAGLVYATSFGFAFQQALSKQHHILEKVTSEISMVDQIATFSTKMTLSCSSIRRHIYKAVKAEAIFMILQLLDREPSSYKNKPTEDIKVKIWSIVDLLRQVDTGAKQHVNRVLCDKILSHIMKLNSICSDRIGVLHTKIHPVKWLFLESLGFFSFIGILLLRAYSYRMELVMCIITVFSISMLCYVVSDLDSPFSGFFRVDLSVLSFVLQKLESMYLESLMEEVESTLSGGIVKVTEIPSEKPGIKKMNAMKREVWYKEKSFV
nr:titin homolog [Crassostrea gigas]